MSLGACRGSSGLDAGCNHPNGNNYQPHEWVGGVYFISDTQVHTSSAPLVGQIYTCSATSSGGWGVGQAACCSTNAQTPLSATRASVVPACVGVLYVLSELAGFAVLLGARAWCWLGR